ncbi:hypothetical protein K9857_13625 [Pseudomonas sp. REP124]|uniref:hypothetical protein n=1 Tax=Pseudomonas sp. REP124 TaxID=2875731 RepID=UPI001CCD01F7|nr:hypothetical protein [Pseudomonas sp. REP124]MBZ9782578.1 hypothetical protein [Pseudomonas sp. REP124]
MLAMVVNDNAGCLNARGVLTFIASRLAPTKSCTAMVQAKCSPTHTDVTFVLHFLPISQKNLHFVGASAPLSGTSVPL